MNNRITSKPQQIPLLTTCLLLAMLAASHASTTNITSSADAGLFEFNPDNNLGGMNFVTSGSIVSGERGRALFRFNVATALPPGAIVTAASVTFKLGTARGVGQTFDLHRVLADWGEGIGSGMNVGAGLGAPANAGEVTWNSRFHGTSAWTTPGGASGTDFIATPSASSVMASTLAFSSVNMATDAQLWLNNSGTNFGWVILAANESLAPTASRILTREDTVNHPLLTLTYELPATPPLLTNLTANAGQFIFSFAAEAGRTYTVESRSLLSSGSWNPTTNFPAQPSPATRSVTNPIAGTEGYFRVRTP